MILLHGHSDHAHSAGRSMMIRPGCSRWFSTRTWAGRVSHACARPRSGTVLTNTFHPDNPTPALVGHSPPYVAPIPPPSQVAYIVVYTHGAYYDDLYYYSEAVHILGAFVLLRKLNKQKNCAGISLRMQEMTAAYIFIRMFCEALSPKDAQKEEQDGLVFTWLHTLLDLTLLGMTCTIIYRMRTSHRSTYMPELDPLSKRWLMMPCIILAVVLHPPLVRINHDNAAHLLYSYWFLVLWAFGVYCETVSVLPQLRMLQYSKVIEPMTSHYIFCLAISRFLVIVHWSIQLLEPRSYVWNDIIGPFMYRWRIPPSYLWIKDVDGIWPMTVFLTEVLQTFLYTDFCFYYVANLSTGGGSLRLPSGISV